MRDIDQLWSEDIAVNGGGTLAMVTGTLAGEQRVYRRMMTNAGDYKQHPGYGAGLPRYIGQNLNFDELEGLIRSQLRLERVVAPQPVPVVTFRQILNGVFVSIAWVDRDTGDNAGLEFNLTDG